MRKSVLILAMIALVALFASSCNSDPVHEHSLIIRNDETGHWSECSECGEKSEVSKHVFSAWVVSEDGTATRKCDCGYEEKAVTASSKRELKAFATNIGDESTIVLVSDIDLDEQINFVEKKKIVLDFNEKTIKNSKDIWEKDEDKKWNSLISVKNGCYLTIKGNGVLDVKSDDCYGINIVDGELTILDGTFTGNVSVVQVQKGSLDIRGGKFSLKQCWEPNERDQYGTRFMLNCIDPEYKNGTAKISVAGGKFLKFNPADCLAEGVDTNFLADGYKSVLVGDEYVVGKE